MIKMDNMKRILEIGLWTGWIKNEKPVSMLFIAKPERGKTELLQNYKDCKGIIFINDATVKGLTEILAFKHKNKEMVNHIIIPDFLNPLSKQIATSRQFIQFISSLVEEGICIVKSAFIDFNLDGFQCGLITAITQDASYEKKKVWRKTGFLSRLVPVSYSYSLSTILEIFESISKQDYINKNKENINLNFPKEKQEVKLDYIFSKEMDEIARAIAIKQKLDGIRLKKNFNVMLKATALSNSRNKVTKDDVDEFKKLCDYINYDFNKVD